MSSTTVRGLTAAVLHTALFALPLAVAAPAALAEPRVVAFLVLAAVFAGAESMSQRSDDRPGEAAALQAMAAAICMCCVFGLSLATRSNSGGWITAALGVAIALRGVGLRMAAMRALGSGFVSEVRAAPPSGLVTRGPYAVRRHPSEAGALAIALGASLLLGSMPALVMCGVCLLPLTLWRVRREEQQLGRLFGRDWARYRATVSAL